jgi:hypothetical protein
MRNLLKKIKDNLPVYYSGIYVYLNNKEILCSSCSEEKAKFITYSINKLFENNNIFVELINISLLLSEYLTASKIPVDTINRGLLQHTFNDFTKILSNILKKEENKKEEN